RLFHALVSCVRSRARSYFWIDTHQVGCRRIRNYITASLFRLAFFGTVNRAGRLAFDRATPKLENWFLNLSDRNPDHGDADQYRGILGRRNGFEPLARKSR